MASCDKETTIAADSSKVMNFANNRSESEESASATLPGSETEHNVHNLRGSSKHDRNILLIQEMTTGLLLPNNCGVFALYE